MVEGKPYRYGLIVAGLCMTAVGLFIMTQERPHIYGTMCGLGVIMVCLGTVWSLCQCYPKVILAPGIQEESLEDLEFTAAAAKHERTLRDRHVVGEHGDSSSSVMCLKGGKVSTNTQHAEALPGFCGQKSSNSRLLPEALKSQCHSCPTLQLV